MGAPAVVDFEKGAVVKAGNLGWDDVPLRDLLAQQLRVPVALDNDFVTWTNYANQYWPAKYLIDRMRGEIALESTPGSGTTLRIRLPVSDNGNGTGSQGLSS